MTDPTLQALAFVCVNKDLYDLSASLTTLSFFFCLWRRLGALCLPMWPFGSASWAPKGLYDLDRIPGKIFHQKMLVMVHQQLRRAAKSREEPRRAAKNKIFGKTVGACLGASQLLPSWFSVHLH